MTTLYRKVQVERKEPVGEKIPEKKVSREKKNGPKNK